MKLRLAIPAHIYIDLEADENEPELSFLRRAAKLVDLEEKTCGFFEVDDLRQHGGCVYPNRNKQGKINAIDIAIEDIEYPEDALT